MSTRNTSPSNVISLNEEAQFLIGTNENNRGIYVKARINCEPFFWAHGQFWFEQSYYQPLDSYSGDVAYWSW